MEATLELDRTPFITSLNAARKAASDFARDRFQATLGADVRGLQQAVRAARTELQRYSSSNYKVTLGADVRGLQQVLRGAKSELSGFAGDDYRATLGADDSALQSTIDAARRSARAFASEAYEASLGADTSEVRSDVEGADQLATRFAREAYEASVGIRGGAQTSVELRAIDQQADAIDGRDVNIDVDADSGAVRSLGDSFKGLATNIRATGTILAAAAIPFAIAGIGAAIPTVLALSASLGGLTLALGSGLVGAAVAATGAMGALGGALALVAAPVSMLLGTLKEYDQSLDTIKASQDAAKAASQSLADAQQGEIDARRNLAQVTAESARAIRAAEQGVKDAREDGAADIEEQERALADTRREGAASIRQAEGALAEARRAGVRSVEDQERALGEARRSASEGVKQAEQALAQARSEAVSSVRDQEQALAETRRSAAQNNAQAEADLESARETLSSATRSLTAAQQELNRAERDEPLLQEQATLDLASARDRASDAARAAAEAVAKYGRGSEEATDALREQRQAELDLETTHREVNRTRREGSSEIQAAREAVKSQRAEEKSAADDLRASEENLSQTRSQGLRDVAQESRNLVAVQKEANQAIAEQQDALQAARQEGARQVAEQRRLLNQTETDAARSIREQQAAVAQARAQATRDEKEQLRALTEARESALEQEKEAQQALAEARRQGAEQSAQAQRQLTVAMEATRRAAEALRDTQKGLREETVKLAPAQKALYDEYQRFRTQAGKAFGPAQNAAARLGVEVLHLAEQYLPRLGKTSALVIEQLAGVFEHFRSELSKPVQQAGITRYLNALPRFTRLAGNAAADLSLALFNVFTRSLPHAQDLLRGIQDLAAKFLDWTQSARGQNSIDRFFENAMKRARQFLGIIGDLSRGVGNVFDAINKSGLDDQAVRGLQDLAGGFAEITRKGTDSRQALNRFMKDARELMPHVGSAVGALVRQIGKIATAAITARQAGHKLTILQEIFRGISRSAKPLRQLVVGTFEQLGPEIAKVIPRLAKFFKTFAGSTGPLVQFVRVINRALQIFNNLPGPIKTTAANLVALKLILGGLGITALVRPLGRFAANMFLLNTATRRLGAKGGLGAVATGIARFAPPLAAVAGIVALAGAFTLAYKNNKKFRESVNETVSRLKAFGENRFREVKAAFRDIFDIPTGVVKKAGTKAGDATVSGYQQAVKRGVQHRGEGSVGFELGFNIGRAISNGLNAWVTGDGEGKPRGIGLRIHKLIYSSSNPVNLGSDIGEGIRKGLKKTDWKAVGERTTKLLGDGATNPAVKNQIIKWWEGIKKSLARGSKELGWGGIGRIAAESMANGFTGGGLIRATAEYMRNWFKKANNESNHSRWKGIGKQAAQALINGFVGGGIINKILETISNAGQRAKEKGDKDFQGAGKDAAGGYLKGWWDTSIPSKIVETIKGGIDAAKKWGQGNSPWGRTRKMGIDAATGFAQGLLEDGGLGKRNAAEMGRKASEAFRSNAESSAATFRANFDQPPTPRTSTPPQATRKVMHSIEEARSASSPGGKAITADEMRQIMKENNGHMLQIMRGAAASVSGSPEFFRFFDSVAAKSFNHLTDMKADAV